MKKSLAGRTLGFTNAKNWSRRHAGAKKRTALDALNNSLYKRTLHPTKGWRPLSCRRTAAANITFNMQHGMGYGGTAGIRKEISLLCD